MRDLAMWEDGARQNRVRAYMVDPHDLESVRGELPGLLLDGCSITSGYYTDNRITGQIKTLGRDSWQDGSWIRLVLECPGYGYAAELATLIPSKISESYRTGALTVSYELQSVLWAVSEDTLPSHFTIGQGARTSEVFERICLTVGKSGTILAGAADHRYTQTVVYELGDTFRSDLYDICSTAGNRLDCDAHGSIVMQPYTAPSQREPDWLLEPDSSRSIVLDEGYGWTDEVGSVASRSVVVYKDGNTEIAASTDVSPASRHSPARRGYTVAAQHQVTDLSPATHSQAQRLAESYLAEDSMDKREMTVKCLYFPVTEGDIVLWRKDGTDTLCLAKDVDISLDDMTLTLTLKEA